MQYKTWISTLLQPNDLYFLTAYAIKIYYAAYGRCFQLLFCAKPISMDAYGHLLILDALLLLSLLLFVLQLLQRPNDISSILGLFHIGRYGVRCCPERRSIAPYPQIRRHVGD